MEKVDPKQGHFRSFLRVAARNFLSNQQQQQAAAKRGGRHVIVSLNADQASERYAREPSHEGTPEKLFERDWARSVLQTAMQRLQQEYEASDQAELFRALSPRLSGGSLESLQEVATRLSSTDGAIRVALHRLRQRFGARVREEVAGTVDDVAQVEDEIRHLMAALRP